MIEKAPTWNSSEAVIDLLEKLKSDSTLEKIQDDYLYWDKVKYKNVDSNPHLLWSVVKLFRTLNSKNLRFGNEQFQYVMTDYLQKATHQFDLHLGDNIGSDIGILEYNKAKFIISSTMEEAISSSQMEGASTTRKRAKEMIQLENKPKTISEQMIMNNFITMNHILKHKNEEITPESLKFIHHLITHKTLENSEEEGAFRANNDVFVVNHVNSEVVHTPPSHIQLDNFVNDFCLFFNTKGQDFIHPIIKACILHFMLAWIHPFADGNGRTARAIFYWFMLKNGYRLTEFLSISKIIKETKSQYEKAFLYTEMDENDLTYFITYHVKAIEKAVVSLKEYLARKQKEVFQATKFMKIPGVNDRMAQIIKLLQDHPERLLTIKEMESRFQVSNYTARTDLKALVELGFLEVIQVNKKKQNFIKSSNFEKLIL